MCRIEDSIGYATKFAIQNTFSDTRLAAVFRIRKTWIVGHNHQRKNTHAEEALVAKCKGDQLRGATIFLSRVLKNDTQAVSRPCPRCQKALTRAGVARVIYTINANEVGILLLASK